MGNLKEPHAYLPDTCITNRDVPKLNENTALVHLYPFAPVGPNNNMLPLFRSRTETQPACQDSRILSECTRQRAVFGHRTMVCNIDWLVVAIYLTFYLAFSLTHWFHLISDFLFAIFMDIASDILSAVKSDILFTYFWLSIWHQIRSIFAHLKWHISWHSICHGIWLWHFKVKLAKFGSGEPWRVRTAPSAGQSGQKQEDEQ